MLPDLLWEQRYGDREAGMIFGCELMPDINIVLVLKSDIPVSTGGAMPFIIEMVGGADWAMTPGVSACRTDARYRSENEDERREQRAKDVACEPCAVSTLNNKSWSSDFS